MFARTIADGAELRPLEPWQAAEFAEHARRVRADIEEYIPGPGRSWTRRPPAPCCRSYAEKQAADRGRIYGIWVDGVLQGGALFRTFDAVQESARWASGSPRRRAGAGWSPRPSGT